MDRDVALTLNTKLSAINTALQSIVTGIGNTPDSNRSIPAGNQRTLQELEQEEPEAPAEEPAEEPEAPAEEPAEEPEPITETTTRKKSTSK